jgi:hypothetical protein
VYTLSSQIIDDTPQVLPDAQYGSPVDNTQSPVALMFSAQNLERALSRAPTPQ